MEDGLALALNAFVAVVLSGFFPASGFVHIWYHLPAIAAERRPIIEIFFGDKSQQVLEARNPYQYLGSYVIPVIFCTLVSVLGLALFFVGSDLPVTNPRNLIFDGPQFFQSTEAGSFYTREGAVVAAGFALLGAYLWGILHISRRFFLKDLPPGLFFSVTVRMIFAPVIALIMYHTADASGVNFVSESAAQGANPVTRIFPLVAFFIGMFPQPAVSWLASKVPFAREKAAATSSALPLSAIDGVTPYDESRLEEAGIFNCLDLATADLLPLFLSTPYSPKKLVHWLLQAKLLIRFPDAVQDLKAYGIHTIADLTWIDAETINQIARQTRLTESALTQASNEVKGDPNIINVQRVVFPQVEDKSR